MPGMQVALRRSPRSDDASLDNDEAALDLKLPCSDSLTATYIVTGSGGKISLTDGQEDDEPNDALALFKSKNGQTLFASLVEGCQVEATDSESGGITLPRSDQGERNYLLIRLGDVVTFSGHAVCFSVQKLAVDSENPLDGPVTTSETPVNEDVQVRSSLASEHGDDQATTKRGSALDAEVNSDLDAPPDHDPAVPDPMSPQRADEASQDVSSQQSSRRKSSDQDDFFSTAPVTSSEPTRQTNNLSALPSKRSKKPITYGKRGKRTRRESTINEDEIAETPVKQNKFTAMAPSPQRDTSPTLEKADELDDSTDDGSIVVIPRRPSNLYSSDPVDEHEAAFKAATRSIHKNKRKSTSTIDEEPTASEQSKRARLSTEPHSSPSVVIHSNTFASEPPKILLSSSRFSKDKKTLYWLKGKGATSIDEVPDKATNFICVIRDGALPTTAKLLRSLALGKPVVTDRWLEASRANDRLLPAADFAHPDLVARDVGRSKVFAGRDIFVTAALHKVYGAGWDDVASLLREAGAREVEYGSGRKWRGKEKKDITAALFVGTDGEDKDARFILTELGFEVYAKNILTHSVLRGELLLDDESLQIHVADADTSTTTTTTTTTTTAKKKSKKTS